MPDSNRGARLPSWVKAVGYGGIVLAACAFLFGLFYQIHYAQQAKIDAAEYASNAAAEAYKPCRVSALPKLDKCLSDAKREYNLKRNDNSRDYADLVAQQRSALWAAVMGIAALIGMMLSAIGVWLVYTTFKETRRTAEIAQRNLEVFQHAERGFVRILDMHILDLPLDPMFKRRYAYTIENFGRSAITVTGTRVWNRGDLSWDFDLENTPGYGSVIQVFCKDGETAVVMGNYEMPTDAENNVFLVMVEYSTLGLVGCRTFFTFALNVDYPSPGPNIIKIHVAGDRPADT